MNRPAKTIKVLLIEDECEWVDKISGYLAGNYSCNIKTLYTYNEADYYLSKENIKKYHAAIIDVRMREQIYDQGGLALLDILKKREPELPTLVLTSYTTTQSCPSGASIFP